MLADMTVKEFLEKTASGAPVPGGGSVAALSAGLAAALTEMVANLTVGKKGYETVEAEMKEVLKAGSECREKFIGDMDRDAESFNGVMEAFKMPKDTEEEKEARKAAIQKGSKEATLVPLQVAKDAFRMMEIIEKVVDNGNQNAVTDGAVAAMMARTAVLSALYNVKINLGSIKDEVFVADVAKQMEELESKVGEVEKHILSKVKL